MHIIKVSITPSLTSLSITLLKTQLKIKKKTKNFYLAFKVAKVKVG